MSKLFFHFLPIITPALARAHAKRIDSAILIGNSSSFVGLVGGAGTDGSDHFLAADSTLVTDPDASGTSDAITSGNLLSIDLKWVWHEPCRRSIYCTCGSVLQPYK